MVNRLIAEREAIREAIKIVDFCAVEGIEGILKCEGK